ncbi:hypothetical protein [Sphingomonas sp. LM7]|uniref:type II toxin-antitoxin system RelB family antitoxin n=1 Tax=Sphingomonas sp. LM7 TaxID=1938607 RepID=UPI000983B737|nr:hypothetical protein [Sphingomonas sp. LM7]AQR73488.1 hypothetical protein BXU08_07415 [Sphingomonas sp. LM7]
MAKLSPSRRNSSRPEADAYDAWFRAKVKKAMNSSEPSITHDEVMREMRAIIDSYRNASDTLAS